MLNVLSTRSMASAFDAALINNKTWASGSSLRIRHAVFPPIFPVLPVIKILFFIFDLLCPHALQSVCHMCRHSQNVRNYLILMYLLLLKGQVPAGLCEGNFAGSLGQRERDFTSSLPVVDGEQQTGNQATHLLIIYCARPCPYRGTRTDSKYFSLQIQTLRGHLCLPSHGTPLEFPLGKGGGS